MSVFSGLIPMIRVSGNSQVNSLVGGLLNNTVASGANFALPQLLGTELSRALGLGPSPATGGDFLRTIISPGLISTGAGALSRVIATSITNSKALGPFGPLAGALAQSGVDFLTNEATKALFGNATGPNGSRFFPGAGGFGEGEANYGIVRGKKSVYSEGSPGPNGGPSDVVFTIKKWEPPAVAQAAAATAANPARGTAGAGAEAPGGTEQRTDPAAPGAPNVTVSKPVPPSFPPTRAPLTPSEEERRKREIAEYNRKLQEYNSAVQTRPPSPTPSPGPAEVPNGADPVKPPSSGSSDSPPQTATPAPKGWTFICPPDDISWETSAQADRISIFGANNSPVISGVKGMRELNLNGAIVEGFSRGKTVEDKISELERSMNMVPTQDGRHLTVPVYQITANGKIYGNGAGGEDGGMFIIKGVKVQEKMRDLDGKTTRALVDISLVQVPTYQVGKSKDIASASMAGVKGPFDRIAQGVEEQAKQKVK